MNFQEVDWVAIQTTNLFLASRYYISPILRQQKVQSFIIFDEKDNLFSYHADFFESNQTIFGLFGQKIRLNWRKRYHK